MSLDPFLNAPFQIQSHAAAALISVSLGPFSPLHGFALLTFWSLWQGIRQVRAGRIQAHKATMRGLYWFGLIIAGLANFLPDRRTNEVFFSGNDSLGWIVIGVGAVVLFGIARAGRSTARQGTAALRG